MFDNLVTYHVDPLPANNALAYQFPKYHTAYWTLS